MDGHMPSAASRHETIQYWDRPNSLWSMEARNYNTWVKGLSHAMMRAPLVVGTTQPPAPLWTTHRACKLYYHALNPRALGSQFYSGAAPRLKKFISADLTDRKCCLRVLFFCNWRGRTLCSWV